MICCETPSLSLLDSFLTFYVSLSSSDVLASAYLLVRFVSASGRRFLGAESYHFAPEMSVPTPQFGWVGLRSGIYDVLQDKTENKKQVRFKGDSLLK